MIALAAGLALSESTSTDGSIRILAPSQKTAPETLPSVPDAGAEEHTFAFIMDHVTYISKAWGTAAPVSSSVGMISPTRPLMPEAVSPPGDPFDVFRLNALIFPILVADEFPEHVIGVPLELVHSLQKSYAILVAVLMTIKWPSVPVEGKNPPLEVTLGTAIWSVWLYHEKSSKVVLKLDDNVPFCTR